MKTTRISILCKDQQLSNQIEGDLTDILGSDIQIMPPSELFKKATGDGRSLYVCSGGDGSLNKAVNEIKDQGLGQSVEILYLPNGTGNDFARGTGLLGLEPRDILKLAIETQPREIFVGKVNDLYFINMASFGEFSKVTPSTDPRIKNLAGRWGYILKGLTKLMNLELQSYKYTIDDGSITEAALVGFFIGNTKYCGGGFISAPEADPEADSLDFFSVGDMPLPSIIELGLVMQSNSEIDTKEFNVSHSKIRKMEVSSERPIPVVLDGEPYENTEMTIELSSEPVLVYLPETSQD